MDKPYAQINIALAAPMSEMIDIVIATLKSQMYGDFNYTETPYRVQAAQSDQMTWGGKKFSKTFQIDVIWREDKNPHDAFQALKLANPCVDPVSVTIRLKHLVSEDQSEAVKKLDSFKQELRQQAKDTAEELPNRPPPTDYGTSQFAALPELQDEDYLTNNATEEVSTRLLLGAFQTQSLSVPRKFTEAHAIVAGPPGVGKSRSIFIPNLVQRLQTSALVTEVVAGEDLTPTVFGHTAGYRAHNGQKIYYFNPADVKNSTRFNIIDFINDVGDAIKYATLIVTNTTANTHIGDQIWPQAETQLLTALLLYAWGLNGKKKAKEGNKGNLGYLRNLLRFGPIELKEIIEANGITEAKDRFGEFIRNSSVNFRLGVVSGLIARLNSWLDPRICQLTEVTDFSQEDLRDNLFTFYLAYPVHRQDYKPIMALALNFLITLPLTKTFNHPLTMFLDEFAAYGTVPTIHDIQATIRNRGIGMVFGFQDQSQLMNVYSHNIAESIFTNCDTKVLFATGSPKAQKQISDLLGPTTKVKKQVSSSGHITRQTYGQPLLGPSEIGKIPKGHVLIWRNQKNPVMAETVPPGTYATFPTQYPPPQKPLTVLKKEIITQCDEAQELKFDPDLAKQQQNTYKSLFDQYQDAEQAYQAAAVNPGSGDLEQLAQKLAETKAAYEALHKDDPVEMIAEEEDNIEIIEHVKPKEPEKKDPVKKPEEPQPVLTPDVDPNDPNLKYYVLDGPDPNQKYYVFDKDKES
jgi:type IV secretory pathway TraG/TraD family ATPase VirD4